MFTGNPAVLDPPGDVDKGAVKNQFLVPTSNDINRIDLLLSMVGDDVWTPDQITTLARALVAFNGQTKPMTLADLAAAINADSSAPFIRASEIGLVGDGVTDDSFTLQTDMEQRSFLGGSVYFLRAQQGQSFYFANTVRVPSNITLLWASPILLAKQASFTVQGYLLAAAGSTNLRLAANALAGATTLTIDTSPAGGGPVSNFLGNGNQISIFGNRDGCSTCRNIQELRVTAVDDGLAQITVAQPLNADYPVTWPSGSFEANYGTPDQTNLLKQASVSATADLAPGDNLVLVSNPGSVQPGEMVLIKDDTTCADLNGIPGGDLAPTGEELNMVVPSVAGDVASSVRLARRVGRAFTVARRLRLMRLFPTSNVVISGARFLSAESPDVAPAPTVPWTEQRYTNAVVFDGCVVPNTDTFGKRGEAFRAYRCLDPVYQGCVANGAKFVQAGEGNGINFDRSTGGVARGCSFDAMRHGTQAVGGNGHSFYECTLTNPRHSPVDAHGTQEIDCHWYDCTLDAGTAYQVNQGRSPIAIAFGNPTFMVGPIACGFHGGSISGFKNPGSGGLEAIINLFPGSRNCVIDTYARDIGQVFQFEDLLGAPGVIASGHRIKVQVDGCASNRMIDIQSRKNGASSDTLFDTRIEVYGRNLNGCIYVVNATELEIANCDIDDSIFPESASYFIEASSCVDLRVIDNRVTNAGRFAKFAGCTGYRVVGNRTTDQSNSTVFRDDGGNSGIWTDNREIGFLGAFDQNPTSSLMIDGRFPGHVDVLDDSVLTLLPIQPKGSGQFFGFSGASFFARFFYDTVTSFIDLDAVTTSNVDASTSVLTGTTGVDGRITISVINATNAIMIENRSGVTARIVGRVD